LSQQFGPAHIKTNKHGAQQNQRFNVITLERVAPPSHHHGSYAQPRVDENICKFAKRGMTPSQIGVILRDSQGIVGKSVLRLSKSEHKSKLVSIHIITTGIAQVKSVTGSNILRILKALLVTIFHVVN
ncbi:hypothetical protein RD792_006537, partial [Penstemon davidsonii]